MGFWEMWQRMTMEERTYPKDLQQPKYTPDPAWEAEWKNHCAAKGIAYTLPSDVVS